MKKFIAGIGAVAVAAGALLAAPALNTPAPTETSVQAGAVSSGAHKGCSRPYTRYTDQYGRAYRIC